MLKKLHLKAELLTKTDRNIGNNTKIIELDSNTPCYGAYEISALLKVFYYRKDE